MADGALAFTSVVLVYPAITAAHVFEEWPGYLPAVLLVTHAALHEGLVGAGELAAIAVFAAVFHVAEVGHNVFARW